MKASERVYHKYEYLARSYANRIHSYSELSFEYEDLLQEFKIKIFTSIKAYGRRWLKYRRQGYNKPVPIKYYLEAACSNKMRDFTKSISRENYKMRIDDINFDFGREMETEFDPKKNKFVINGVNLLEGLSGRERIVYILFIKGFNKNFLNKVYFNEQEKIAKKNVIKNGDEPFDAMDIVQMQNDYLLKKYRNDLFGKNDVYQTYNLEV